MGRKTLGYYYTTFSTMTLSIMTFSIMTFSIMIFSIMTFSIMTFSITTPNIKTFSGLYYKHVTIINDDSSIISEQSF